MPKPTVSTPSILSRSAQSRLSADRVGEFELNRNPDTFQDRRVSVSLRRRTSCLASLFARRFQASLFQRRGRPAVPAHVNYPDPGERPALPGLQQPSRRLSGRVDGNYGGLVQPNSASDSGSISRSYREPPLKSAISGITARTTMIISRSPTAVPDHESRSRCCSGTRIRCP